MNPGGPPKALRDFLCRHSDIGNASQDRELGRCASTVWQAIAGRMEGVRILVDGIAGGTDQEGIRLVAKFVEATTQHCERKSARAVSEALKPVLLEAIDSVTAELKAVIENLQESGLQPPLDGYNRRIVYTDIIRTAEECGATPEEMREIRATLIEALIGVRSNERGDDRRALDAIQRHLRPTISTLLQKKTGS